MKDFNRRIRQKGMALNQVQMDENFLRELSGLQSNTASTGMTSREGQPRASYGNTDANDNFNDLKKELQEEPNTAMKKNFDKFERKFDCGDWLWKSIVRVSDIFRVRSPVAPPLLNHYILCIPFAKGLRPVAFQESPNSGLDHGDIVLDGKPHDPSYGGRIIWTTSLQRK